MPSLQGTLDALSPVFNFVGGIFKFLWERKFTTAAAIAGTYGSYELADYFNYYQYNGDIAQHARLCAMGIVGGTASLEIVKNLGLWIKNGHTGGQYHNGYIAQYIVGGNPGALLPILSIGSGVFGAAAMNKIIEAGEMFPDDPAMQAVYVIAGGVATGMMGPRAVAYGHRKLKYGV